MIKINLKNTKTSSPIYSKTETNMSDRVDFQTTVTTVFKEWFQADLSALDPFVFLYILIKLLVIAAFPVGLYIYENRIINELEGTLNIAEQKNTSRQKILNDLKQKIDSHGYLKDKSNEYDNKKIFLKGLASSRLIIPQLLDQVQSIIPESVWLKKIEVGIAEKGTLKIVGESLGEDRVNLFADSLKTIVERDSIKVNMNDIKENNNSVKVNFSLSASLLNRRSF